MNYRIHNVICNKYLGLTRFNKLNKNLPETELLFPVLLLNRFSFTVEKMVFRCLAPSVASSADSFMVKLVRLPSFDPTVRQTGKHLVFA